jgi:ABC-type sugar transport system ATPase subunit
VLDPLHSKGWGNTAKFFGTVEELIDAAKKSNDHLLVIDEAVVSLNRYDASQNWLATSSRHFGHASIFIGHNLTTVAFPIRTQCTQIFVFGCSRSDARDLADEFDDDRIMLATRMPTFHFVRIQNHVADEGRVAFGVVDRVRNKIFIA